MDALPMATASAAPAVHALAAADAARARKDAAAAEAAQSFEAQFLSQMLEPMFAGLGTGGPLGGGHAEEVWRSFLLQEYGKVIAKSGGLGIADAVKQEILRAQEGP
jgi:peptidoglycan hydrolase FlgJ